MNYIISCLQYALSTGGTTVSVGNFQRAMNGSILSYSYKFNPLNPDFIQGDYITHIQRKSGMAGRFFAATSNFEKARAREILSAADIISTHMLYRNHAVQAAKVAIEKNIPLLTVPHGSLDPYVFTYRSPLKKNWLRIYKKQVLDNAAAVIFSTNAEREKALPWLSNKGNSVVVPWPVDVPDIENEKKASFRDEIRTHLGIPKDDRLLLYLGRLHPMKKPMETIAFVEKIANRGVHLVLAGPSSKEITTSDLTKYVQEKSLRNIHIFGPAFGLEKKKIFCAADGFVSLSHRENFGYSTAEAMAYGLPILISKGNDLNSEIKKENVGWCLQTDNYDEIAGAFIEFAESSNEMLSEKGANGMRWAKAHLSRDKFKSNLESLFRNVLS